MVVVTWDTGERNVEVALEVLVARIGHIERRVGHTHGTQLATRASLVQVRDDVTRAADEPEVSLDARPNGHTTVQRRRHQDDARASTDCTELVVVTVLFAVTTGRYNHPRNNNYNNNNNN